MRKHILFIIAFTTYSLIAQDIRIPIDTTVVTTNSVVIKGKTVNYKATTGMQPVWNSNGKIVATLNYTYYTRTGVKNQAKRPLIMSFNGGPGSASVWMHIAYTRPKILKIDD